MSEDFGDVSNFQAPSPKKVPELQDGDHYICLDAIGETIEDPEASPEGILEAQGIVDWLGLTTELTKVEVVSRFTDDHESCFDLILTNQDKDEIGISIWWVSPNVEAVIRNAARGKPVARKMLLDFILEAL